MLKCKRIILQANPVTLVCWKNESKVKHMSQLSPQTWPWLILVLVWPYLGKGHVIGSAFKLLTRHLLEGKCSHHTLFLFFESGLKIAKRYLTRSLHRFPFEAPEFFFSFCTFLFCVLRSFNMWQPAVSQPAVVAAAERLLVVLWWAAGGINHKTDNFSDLWNGNTVILCL